MIINDNRSTQELGDERVAYCTNLVMVSSCVSCLEPWSGARGLENSCSSVAISRDKIILSMRRLKVWCPHVEVGGG